MTPTNAAQLGLPASVEGLSAEVSVLRSFNAELQTQNQHLKHDIMLLQRKLYGVRTEQTGTEEQQRLFTEMAEAEAALQNALIEAEEAATARKAAEAAEPKPRAAGAAPKGRRDLSQSKLPRVEVEIPSSALEALGLPRVGCDTSYELIARKASYAVLVKKTVRYAETRETPERDDATTVSAEQLPRVCTKSLFHESVLAKVLAEKFGLGTTLYRLEKHLATQEVAIDRGTMSRLIEQAGNALGATVVAAMFAHAKATAHVISTDATGAWILPEPSQVKQPSGRYLAKRCDKGHFFTAVVDADAVLFFYERAHTQIAVKQLFEGFTGYLQADASSVYHLLEHGPPRDDDTGGVTLVGCFAHCRRYFFEAAQCRYPDGVAGLLRIAEIFAADKPLWKLTPTERHAARAKDVAPLIDDFFAWVHARRAAPPMAARNLMSRALGYAANQEAELRRVLLDPRLPLDNTRAERALRTAVISRKNSLFHGSDTHAEATAAIFSLLQTCRLHGIDPQAYFEDVLRLLPQWPRDRYLELAPNFWRATRARLVPDELAAPLCWFTIPAPQPA
jgi:transposase